MKYDPSASHVGNAIKADNYIKIVPNHSLDDAISQVGGQVTSGYFGEFTIGASSVTIAHEFGHMLYLNDHYSKSNPSTICSGFTAKNIMANGNPTKIDPRDINDVIEGDRVGQCK